MDVGVDRLRQFPLPAYDAGLSVVVALVESLISGLSNDLDIESEPSMQFIRDLLDACVMECYFREHMSERNLLVPRRSRPATCCV